MPEHPSISSSTIAPLLSWDFFLENYQRLMQKGDDLNAIKKLAKQKKWNLQWDLHGELVNNDMVIVVTNTESKIVFATQNIIEMTGYQASELEGKNPKIFQGNSTDRKTVNYIGAKIVAMQPFDTIVVNYKKDGTPYNCHIKGFPVFNESNELVNYIAFERAA